jgi:hypothetical protein
MLTNFFKIRIVLITAGIAFKLLDSVAFSLFDN